MGNAKSKQTAPSHMLVRNQDGKCTLKVYFVGDCSVGKTCLLITHTGGKFPAEYVPTVFDNYEAPIHIEGEEVITSFWDTAGEEGYARIRTMSYPKTDIFVLTFSVVNHSSFDGIIDRWYIEVKEHEPNAKIVLLGTKIDLRKDLQTLENLRIVGKAPLTQEDGIKMAKSIGAVCYLECSALTREKLTEVFHHILYNIITGIPSKYSSAKSARK